MNEDATTCAWCRKRDDVAAEIRDGRCERCGRSSGEIQRARKWDRAIALAIGITMQVMAGILIWLFPPGSSLIAFVIYVSLGLVGFAHIFYALEFGRAPEGASEPNVLPQQDEPLPVHAQRCPACDASLAAAVPRGVRVCPDCAEPFSLRDLGWRGDDPAGEPKILARGERRLGGPILVAITVILLAGAMFAIVIGMSPPGAPAGP